MTTSDHDTHHDPAVRLLIAQAEKRGAERALRDAAIDVQEECRESDAPCFCGSADWLRDRADRIGGAS